MYRFLPCYFTIIVIIGALCLVASIKILDRGIQPLKSESAGIFFFITVENESRLEPYHITSRTERCCLRVNINEEDCASIDLIGGNLGTIQPEEKSYLVLVYPTTFQHDKLGHCVVSLFARCDRSPDVTKSEVKIPFDTRTFSPESESYRKTLFKDYFQVKTPTRCLSPDEDSLRDCEPVKCDLKYGGKKPFFDCRSRRCVLAANCVQDPAGLQDLVYIPSSNVCRDLKQPITANDLNLITFGPKTTPTSEPVIEQYKDVKIACNCSTLSQYTKYLVDLLFVGDEVDKYQDCSKEATAAMIAMGVLLFTACWQLSFCVGSMFLVIRLREMFLDGSMQKKTSSLMIRLKTLTARIKDRTSGKAEEEEGVTQYLMLNKIASKVPEPDIRQSVTDLCERMSREVSRSRRYRPQDVGSQISLAGGRGRSDDLNKRSSTFINTQK